MSGNKPSGKRRPTLEQFGFLKRHVSPDRSTTQQVPNRNDTQTEESIDLPEDHAAAVASAGEGMSTLESEYDCPGTSRSLLVKNQPPKTFPFPKRKFGKRYRSFNHAWFGMHSWLHYDVEKDAAFCYECMKYPSVKIGVTRKIEDSFVSHGVINWKKALEKFADHAKSDHHKAAVEQSLLPAQCGDIGETLSHIHAREKAFNREMLLCILRNIRYLARQGIALRGQGSGGESNFIQLMKKDGETDPRILGWLDKKDQKYISADCQNECLQIMALSVLRDIASNVQEAVFFTLMADEVTDAANKEQLVICLRWVDSDFNVHEDVIGLYLVDNIAANTIVTCLKDTVLRMRLSISNCRGQCYDGAANMNGAKSGVSTQIKREEKRALMTHCYGHSLQLAMCDTIKNIRLLRDTLDTTKEISNLIKYSPKRDQMLDKLKAELAPGTPGFRTLCPTRWTVRSGSLQSVIDNWRPLQQLWDDCLEQRLDAEVRARIVGVKAMMTKFDYYFGVNLALLVLRHGDNLSKTLQQTKMSAVDGQAVAKLTLKTLETLKE